MSSDISTQRPIGRPTSSVTRAAICSAAIALAALLPVDDATCSASFQAGRRETWGPLAHLYATVTLARGIYQVTARICSVTGACGTMSVTVKLAPNERIGTDAKLMQ
jgi:hypothetical protein